MRILIGPLSLLAGLTGVIALPRMASAHGGDSSGMQFPSEVPSVTKEGAQAKDLLARLEKDPLSAAVAKDSIASGKRALQRAHGAADAGDRQGAFLLSRLALGHAHGAEAVARAALAEKKANEAQTKSADVRDKLSRQKTLLAETQAQRGQVAAELARAEGEAKDAAQKTQTKEDDRVQKGAKKADGKKSDTPKTDGKKSDAPKTDGKKSADAKKGSTQKDKKP